MLRFISILWFCLALTGCASSPRTFTKDSYDPYLMVQQSPAQLPLLSAGNHQWQVRAELNGESGNFAVDTGSDTTIITPQFAQKLGLLDTALKGDFHGSNQIGQQARFAHLTYLRLGGLLYVNFYVPILNLDHLNRATHTQLDGILGNNVLDKTTCTLDWQNHLLTLNADGLAQPANALPITTRHYHTYLTALVNGQPLEFVLDTGAYSSSLTENDSVRLQIPEPKKSQIQMPRADITEINPLKQTQVSLDSFQLGPINRTNFPMLTWHNNVLGMDLLEPWVVTFDTRAHWLSFTQPDPSLQH
jgi:predicted aspartyl protease